MLTLLACSTKVLSHMHESKGMQGALEFTSTKMFEDLAASNCVFGCQVVFCTCVAVCRLTQRIYSLLIRHPEYFYVSQKGGRYSVFLREAYSGDVLVQRDELATALERLRMLSLQREHSQSKYVDLEESFPDSEVDAEQASVKSPRTKMEAESSYQRKRHRKPTEQSTPVEMVARLVRTLLKKAATGTCKVIHFCSFDGKHLGKSSKWDWLPGHKRTSRRQP